MSLIHNFSDKWHEIGLGLGFAFSKLNQISSNPLYITVYVMYIYPDVHCFEQDCSEEHGTTLQ